MQQAKSRNAKKRLKTSSFSLKLSNKHNRNNFCNLQVLEIVPTFSRMLLSATMNIFCRLRSNYRSSNWKRKRVNHKQICANLESQTEEMNLLAIQSNSRPPNYNKKMCSNDLQTIAGHFRTVIRFIHGENTLSFPAS